ncbi:MAG: DNA-binding domain-containing protein, partial [Flavobacteriales bacterium]
MLQLNKTFSVQSALASFCKKGEYKSIEGVNEERAKHYRRMVYNVIDDTLQSAFPLTLALLTEEEWNYAVDLFFSTHAAQTPILWRLPEEFVDFSNSLEFPLKKKYPFISELLLFEWMEVKIFMVKDISSEFSTQGNIQSDKLVLNPESQFLHFTYPVHLKKANEISEEDKGNYFLVMYYQFCLLNYLMNYSQYMNHYCFNLYIYQKQLYFLLVLLVSSSFFLHSS